MTLTTYRQANPVKLNSPPKIKGDAWTYRIKDSLLSTTAPLAFDHYTFIETTPLEPKLNIILFEFVGKTRFPVSIGGKSETVANLKLRMQKLYQFDPTKIRLICRNIALQNDKLLSFYNVVDGKVVNMALKI